MKEKTIKITFCTLFILIISVMGILTIMNHNGLSTKEGRVLAQFPKLTAKGVLSTSYYTDLTNAYADQLAFREDLIKLYYLVNLQRYTGDVVKAEDGELFLSPQIISDKEKHLKNIAKVAKKQISEVAKEVTEAGAEFIFLSIPRKDVMMEEYLPDTYIRGTEMYLKSVETIKANVSEDVIVVDAYDILKDKVEKPFYKTDHHMNIRGAYTIFEWLINHVNNNGSKIKIGKLEDEYTIISKVINGAFNRKIGQSVKAGEEELNLIYKGESVTYMRWDEGEANTVPIFGEGNTYASAYMGNDMPETVIETNNDDAPNILFVGSSYTNILESLSVFKFNKMVSIDYRHNTSGKSIADYVKEHDIDYTVFICSQSTNAFSISSIKEHLGLEK